MKKSNKSKQICIVLLLWSISVPRVAKAQTATSLVQAVYGASVRGPVPMDFTIDATVTDQQGVKPLRIFIKGSNKIRYERGSGPDLLVTIFNANQGWLLVGSQVQALPTHVSVQRPSLIPALDLIAEHENAQLVVTDRGLALRGGQTTRHLSLSLPDPVQRRPFGKKLDEALDVFLDPVTLLVVRTERRDRVVENLEVTVPSSMAFSDYRVVSGVSVPFRIQLSSGTPSNTLHQSEILVSNVTVNTNLDDALFAPPGGAR